RGGSAMQSQYPGQPLQRQQPGYYERVAESATHYQQRLLNSRKQSPPTPEDVQAIANRLVYSYKHHGFAIDSREATDIFGEDVVVCNTPAYALADELFVDLDFAEFFIRTRFKRGF